MLRQVRGVVPMWCAVCDSLCRRNGVWRSFAFDKVWDADVIMETDPSSMSSKEWQGASQADIFLDIEPLVMSVVEGYNTCIMACGQTSSGKTYTMNGYGVRWSPDGGRAASGGENIREETHHYGVSYRALVNIFDVLHAKQQEAKRMAESTASTGAEEKAGAALKYPRSSGRAGPGSSPVVGFIVHDNKVVEHMFYYTVKVSMLEVYNETVRDLLAVPGTEAAAGVGGGGEGFNSQALDIRQMTDGTIVIPGMIQETVNTIEDVMKVFAKGTANRATGTTNLNEHSSRSHSILIVEVTTCYAGGAPKKAKLHIVDLAGSENVSKSGVTGQAMKEAQYINKSLSALGDVMEALDSKSKHVPYRNSKLTFLLQDCLGGNARTMMIATICPTDIHMDETLFTLQFATRVRSIALGSTAKKNVDHKNLEEQYRKTKAELKEAQKKIEELVETLRVSQQQVVAASAAQRSKGRAASAGRVVEREEVTELHQNVLLMREKLIALETERDSLHRQLQSKQRVPAQLPPPMDSTVPYGTASSPGKGAKSKERLMSPTQERRKSGTVTFVEDVQQSETMTSTVTTYSTPGKRYLEHREKIVTATGDVVHFIEEVSTSSPKPSTGILKNKLSTPMERNTPAKRGKVVGTTPPQFYPPAPSNGNRASPQRFSGENDNDDLAARVSRPLYATTPSSVRRQSRSSSPYERSRDAVVHERYSAIGLSTPGSSTKQRSQDAVLKHQERMRKTRERE